MIDYKELHVDFDPQPNRLRFLVTHIVFVWLLGLAVIIGIAVGVVRLFQVLIALF